MGDSLSYLDNLLNYLKIKDLFFEPWARLRTMYFSISYFENRWLRDTVRIK